MFSEIESIEQLRVQQVEYVTYLHTTYKFLGITYKKRRRIIRSSYLRSGLNSDQLISITRK